MKLLFLALLPALSPMAVSAAAAPRPHIVFLMADDLGRADVGFMGGREIPTPHLDRLARAGAILDQFYVQPVCSPTRAAFLTGRYPMRLGLQVGVVRPWADYGLPLSERLLPQALQEAGYQTALVGKWHLGAIARGYLPTQRGFDQQYGHYNGAIDYFTHQRDGGHDWHRNDEENHDEGYSTHLIARESVRIIEAHDKTRPLFLYVPFNAVHSPWQVPPSYIKPFSHLQGNRALYAGMLAAMDEAVGQISAAIETNGMRANTLFVFCSDNGGPNPGVITDNGPLRAGKGTLYEGGTRVCAFATWDGQIKAGSVVTAPLHIVDWHPTLLKLAGAALEQQAPVDGRDAWPAITGGAGSPHDFILYNTTPSNGAIRVGDWKLVVNGHKSEIDGDGGNTKKKQRKAPNKKLATQPTGGTGAELFNLTEDPGEKRNLALEYPDKTAELKRKLADLAAQALPPKGGPQPAGFVIPRVWGQRE